MNNSEITKHSRAIRREYLNKPAFIRPNELITALKAAKSAIGKYPVLSGRNGWDSFVNFLTESELRNLKGFDRKPRWKQYSKTAKQFKMKIADLFTGEIYPENTPYSVDGFWTKRWGVCYTVDIFVDGGCHIHTEHINSKKPLPLKKVLKTAVENTIKLRGQFYDGYKF